MKEDTNQMAMEQTVQQFVELWTGAVQQRKRAAELYFQSVQENAAIKYEYRAYFPQWNEQQWRVLYYIGAGTLSEALFDMHPYTIPTAFLYLNISHAWQVKICTLGLPIYINGRKRTIRPASITDAQLKQVFKRDGTVRTKAEQKAYEEAKVAKDTQNFVDSLKRVDAGWLVPKRGVITRDALVRMLQQTPPLIEPAELHRLAQMIQ